MIVDKTCSRPYARALFELAAETDAVDLWSQRLGLLKQIVQDDAVARLVSDRMAATEAVVDFMVSLQPNVLDVLEVRRVLQLLSDRRRLRLLPFISDLFEATRRLQQNQKKFKVVSSVPLKQEQQKKFQDYLNQKFKCQAQVTFEKRDDMMGGVQIVGEDWVMDYSIKGLLKQLNEQLSV